MTTTRDEGPSVKHTHYRLLPLKTARDGLVF